MERVSLLKVGGICAILYTIVVIAVIIPLAAADLLEDVDAAELLQIMAEDQTLIATVGWLFVLAPILLAIAGLSLFQALRQAGSLTWVALLSFVGGSLLILNRSFIWLAMTYKLAPAYVGADETAKSTLAIVGDTLVSFGFMAELVAGGVLIGGIGVLLFSLAILRTTVAPKWVAWLGFPVALLAGFFTLLGPVAEVFEIIELIGFLGFLVWMVALGVALWRAPEPASA